MNKPLGRPYRTLFAASTISNLGDGIGVVAYPWLASAVTRDPLLVSLIIVAQRLPWLVFSLPAGVISDRYDRRALMAGANAVRAALTAVVAVGVFAIGDRLPSPDVLDTLGTDLDTNVGGYTLVLAATLLLGCAEVLYDNTAQTIMPSLVEDDQLERANGRLWSSEQVMNTLAGPAFGAVLLTATFALPFGVYAVTFAVSAVLVAQLPKREPTPRSDEYSASAGSSMRADIAEGFRWLWNHELLRPLAITLALLNMAGSVSLSAFVLYAQEVLGTSPVEFAILQTGGAVGGIVAGWAASAVSKRLGQGPALWATLVVGGLTTIAIGLTSSWLFAWLMFAVFMFFAVLWNVITVSLRQAIIPDELLGRVNSVYRFFAWGSMPIGALIGGLLIIVGETFGSRDDALRLPWLVSGGLQLLLLMYAVPRLTSERMSRARANAGVSDG